MSTMLLNLDDEDMMLVEDLADALKTNKTEIIRKAVRLAYTIETRAAAGDELYVKDAKGKKTQVISLRGI